MTFPATAAGMNEASGLQHPQNRKGMFWERLTWVLSVKGPLPGTWGPSWHLVQGGQPCPRSLLAGPGEEAKSLGAGGPGPQGYPGGPGGREAAASSAHQAGVRNPRLLPQVGSLWL